MIIPLFDLLLFFRLPKWNRSYVLLLTVHVCRVASSSTENQTIWMGTPTKLFASVDTYLPSEQWNDSISQCGLVMPQVIIEKSMLVFNNWLRISSPTKILSHRKPTAVFGFYEMITQIVRKIREIISRWSLIHKIIDLSYLCKLLIHFRLLAELS